jgi:peroxin-7
MSSFRTQFQACAVKFSPFEEAKVAVATAQNFGIVGNGKQYVLVHDPRTNSFKEYRSFDTVDGLYDCAWSEENENILVSASGDGSVKVWDVQGHSNPLRSFEEHTHEVYALSWNTIRKDRFLSASWDDTVKMWSLGAPRSLGTFAGHSYCVYAVQWNPREADVFLSASGDCTVKIWDVRQPAPTLSLRAHGHEVLTADWCKYNDCILATGSVDTTIKVWDVRMPNRELATLGRQGGGPDQGHTHAVRKVVFSPWSPTVIGSCGYDMSVRLWDYRRGMLRVWGHHTEFAVGLDFSVMREGVMASCGWDGQTHVFGS